MAKPNLALIPATIGDKVYSILPSDGVGDFDFTRASTATRINAQGLIETVASGENRLNYPLIDGVVSGCPSLLLENSATNLLPYSQDFSNSAWIKSNSTVLSNQVISPDGTLNADKISEQNVNGIHYVGTGLSGGAGEYTWSCFLKQGTSKYGGMRAVVNGFSNRFFVNVDLSNGNVVDTHIIGSGTTWEYNVEKYPNGWYRLIIQAANGSGNMDMSISTSNSAQPNYSLGLPTYLGNTNNNLYVYGAQFEAGSYPTSYIKSNSGSATTRSAETCNNSGDANTFNDSEGVLMAEISGFNETVSVNNWITISDETSNNYIAIQQETTGYVIARVKSSGVTQALMSTLINQEIISKIAVKYKENDFALWINGFELSTDTSGSVFSADTLTKLHLNYIDVSNDFYGNTKQIQYFDTTDIDLEQLTSWDSFRAMAEGQQYNIE